MLIFSEQLTADCCFFFFLLHHWGLAYNQLQGFQAVLLTDLELSVSLSESLLHFPTPCTFPSPSPAYLHSLLLLAWEEPLIYGTE